jgi:hypothetical protein
MYNNTIFVPKSTDMRDLYILLHPYKDTLPLYTVEFEEGISHLIVKEFIRILKNNR